MTWQITWSWLRNIAKLLISLLIATWIGIRFGRDLEVIREGQPSAITVPRLLPRVLANNLKCGIIINRS